MEPKDRIEELTKILNHANHRYYVLDDPEQIGGILDEIQST